MLPALLHALSLAVALLVQSTASVFAGVWLMLHLLACTILLYRNEYPRRHSLLWFATVVWMVTLLVATFIINPVSNGAYWCAVLTAMPLLAISLTKQDLPAYVKGFAAALVLYALVLSLQYFLPLGPKTLNDGRVAFPLLDPNNAACMMNFGLIPALYFRRWKLSALFGFALYATGSKTGMAAASISGLFMLSSLYGGWVWLAGIFATCVEGVVAFFYRPDIIAHAAHSFSLHSINWWEGWQVLQDHMWRGVGLGRFSNYAVIDKGTIWTTPFFVHNDTLQFAVEMGVPVAFVFIGMVLAFFRQACRTNLVTTCTMLAVFIQSCMEFQFYLPSVTLCSGLALAYHIINSDKLARPPRKFRFHGFR